MHRKLRKVLACALMLPIPCFAAHPLVTDDTGTLGAANKQIELNADWSRSQSAAATARNRLMGVDDEVEVEDESVARIRLTNLTLTYGSADTVDIALNIPHLRSNAGSEKEQGIGDIALELKWQFFEAGSLSFGLKPQLLLPTGNKRRELGNGRMSYGTNLLAAYESDSFIVLSNVGYLYNNNVVNARKNLWNASAAWVWKARTHIQLALDVGSYRNPDRSSNQNPAFALFGLIYSPYDKLDLDIGWRKGLNRAEEDYVIGAGITYRW